MQQHFLVLKNGKKFIFIRLFIFFFFFHYYFTLFNVLTHAEQRTFEYVAGGHFFFVFFVKFPFHPFYRPKFQLLLEHFRHARRATVAIDVSHLTSPRPPFFFFSSFFLSLTRWSSHLLKIS